jgi:hypothetical protein
MPEEYKDRQRKRFILYKCEVYCDGLTTNQKVLEKETPNALNKRAMRELENRDRPVELTAKIAHDLWLKASQLYEERARSAPVRTQNLYYKKAINSMAAAVNISQVMADKTRDSASEAELRRDYKLQIALFNRELELRLRNYRGIKPIEFIWHANSLRAEGKCATRDKGEAERMAKEFFGMAIKRYHELAAKTGSPGHLLRAGDAARSFGEHELAEKLFEEAAAVRSAANTAARSEPVKFSRGTGSRPC